jgi:branched-subunit amino acid transport protein
MSGCLFRKEFTGTFAMFDSQRLLILLLSVMAALRVLVFAAAFPFFSNGDEDLHFDVITQYSAGRLPHTFDVLTNESLSFIVPCASPEFLQTPDQFPNAKFPPPLWKLSAAEAAPIIEVTKAAWQNEINWESSQPPLYYALAGVWWKVSQYIGLTQIESLYWIRFLNGLLAALVVWLGYVAARTIAPERIDLSIGVPLLLAFIPQDVLYVLSNDMLSPVCFGVVFLCVIRWLRAESPSLLFSVTTGLAIAATYLTKLTNLPLLTVAMIAIVARWLQMPRQRSGVAILALVLTILSAGVPIGAWMLWSKYHFGDVTGSTTTIALLSWTPKPFADWWHHPIFSPQGLWTFWYEVIARFWRGELMWQNRELSWRVADEFYAISSLVFVAAAILGLRRQAGLSAFQRRALFLAALTFVAALAFLALLSVRFDFGECIYPSRAHPYFTSGRLMSGALIPFALLYVYGIGYLLRRVGGVAPIVVVAGIMAFATVSEIFINRIVFVSEHNWFHL